MPDLNSLLNEDDQVECDKDRLLNLPPGTRFPQEVDQHITSMLVHSFALDLNLGAHDDCKPCLV